MTVTGKGFSTGSATIFIDKSPGAAEDDTTTEDVDETDDRYDANGEFDRGVDEIISTGAAITDGSFTATIAGIDKPDVKGLTKITINAFDGANLVGDKADTYEFKSGLTVEPESRSWGQTLTLKMSDNTVVPRRGQVRRQQQLQDESQGRRDRQGGQGRDSRRGTRGHAEG